MPRDPVKSEQASSHVDECGRLRLARKKAVENQARPANTRIQFSRSRQYGVMLPIEKDKIINSIFFVEQTDQQN